MTTKQHAIFILSQWNKKLKLENCSSLPLPLPLPLLKRAERVNRSAPLESRSSSSSCLLSPAAQLTFEWLIVMMAQRGARAHAEPAGRKPVGSLARRRVRRSSARTWRGASGPTSGPATRSGAEEARRKNSIKVENSLALVLARAGMGQRQGQRQRVAQDSRRARCVRGHGHGHVHEQGRAAKQNHLMWLFRSIGRREH